MGREVYYRQCRLIKRTLVGQLIQLSWIPEPHATVGKMVRLREEDGSWNDGWLVSEAGTHRLTGDQLPDYHQISRAHLRATGDAQTTR